MLWTIDPTHAAVEFSVKHMAIARVKGAFKTFSGGAETDEAGAPTALTMEIDAASLDTNNDQRDAHLRSGDFFDVGRFPSLTFRSTKISGGGANLTIVGDLTIRDVTKPVTMQGELSQTVRDPWGNQRASLAVSGSISRAEWGLTWNQLLEFGGLAVSDEVRLHVEAEAVAVVEEAVAA